jgi:hypothetical protein
MAYTVSFIAKTVFGDKRAHLMKITADNATQTVETGLGVIDAFALGACSMNSGTPRIYVNSNASGVQSNGVLGISGVANGDVFFVTVYGR